MILRIILALVSGLAATLYMTSCTPTEPGPLDKLGTVRVSIAGQPFELWIADQTPEITQGLMFVTAEQMAPLADGTRRGMLFVFDHERYLDFWMKNTIIPLDIAYLDSSGIIVATHTMVPLDDRSGQYPSGEPARFAIEVNANVLSELSVAPGDNIMIPASVLKRTR